MKAMLNAIHANDPVYHPFKHEEMTRGEKYSAIGGIAGGASFMSN